MNKKFLKICMPAVFMTFLIIIASCSDNREGYSTFTSPTIGAKLVLIPAGKFLIGPSDKQHEVVISKDYYMQTTEITQGQWKKVMGSNPSWFDKCGDNCPVERVSWNDAQKFIERLNQRENTNKYRLPTEAEWEYAARAGTNTALYTGNYELISENNAPALDPIAWYTGNSCADYEGANPCSNVPNKQYNCEKCGPHPVAKKQANAWGLYDMLGNVWEWCQDWYGEYPANSVVDPTGPTVGTHPIIRGGSWSYVARLMNASTTQVSSRYGTNKDNDSADIGFRLARTK